MNLITKNIRSDISVITDQIASLKHIEKNENNEFNSDDVKLAQNEIKNLTDQQGKFKIQLSQAKFEFQKVELEKEKIRLTECRVSNDGKLAAISDTIIKEEEKLRLLENLLANFDELAKFRSVHNEKQGCEQSILRCKNTISTLKTEESKLSLLAKKDEFDAQVIRAQIFNLNDMTRLKNQLIDCKSRLEQLQLTSSIDRKNTEDLIRSEMKEIIKEMIHSKSYLSLMLELRKAKDCLANLEYLQNEGQAVEASEIDSLKNNIKLLEKQIELELTKVKLQEQLKEAQITLENLRPLLTVKGIEDVSKTVKEASQKVDDLTKEISKITAQSLAVVKSLDGRTVEQLPGNGMAFNIPGLGIVVEELQKWLSENILEETLDGDVQEVVITAALLQFTKVRNLGANQEGEASGIAAKVKEVAIGSCEKFCMGQVVQHIAAADPTVITGSMYVLGLLAQHFILGDGQLSTLAGKVGKFAVAETIKTAGNFVLGGALVGVVGSSFAITASAYITYLVLISLFSSGNMKTGSQIDPTADISAAGIDMLADATVTAIFDSIISSMNVKN